MIFEIMISKLSILAWSTKTRFKIRGDCFVWVCFRTGMVYILTWSTKPRFKIWGLISYRYGLFLAWTAPKVKMNHTNTK